jgi:hypothetical protein
MQRNENVPLKVSANVHHNISEQKKYKVLYKENHTRLYVLQEKERKCNI